MVYPGFEVPVVPATRRLQWDGVCHPVGLSIVIPEVIGRCQMSIDVSHDSSGTKWQDLRCCILNLSRSRSFPQTESNTVLTISDGQRELDAKTDLGWWMLYRCWFKWSLLFMQLSLIAGSSGLHDSEVQHRLGAGTWRLQNFLDINLSVGKYTDVRF